MQRASVHARFYDYAGPAKHSRYHASPCFLPECGNTVGAREIEFFAAQWLACTLPYRRFAGILADACARLGADVIRYTFIVVDLHHLLSAGRPAHSANSLIRSVRERPILITRASEYSWCRLPSIGLA